MNDVTFGQAIKHLNNGGRAFRRGWNGVGIFIKLQVPDENSKMTGAYIYLDTTGLQTENPDAPKMLIPWQPSQTDMLAKDWVELSVGEAVCEDCAPQDDPPTK